MSLRTATLKEIRHELAEMRKKHKAADEVVQSFRSIGKQQMIDRFRVFEKAVTDRGMAHRRIQILEKMEAWAVQQHDDLGDRDTQGEG